MKKNANKILAKRMHAHPKNIGSNKKLPHSHTITNHFKIVIILK